MRSIPVPVRYRPICRTARHFQERPYGPTELVYNDRRASRKLLFSGSESCPVCERGAYRKPPTLDVQGHQALVRTGGVGSVSSHNGLRDLLCNTLRDLSVRVNVYREKTFAADLGKDPTERRALNLVINDAAFASRPQRIDVNIINPHSSAYRKHGTYDDFCAAEGTEMRTATSDIYGQLGQEGQGVIQYISRYIATRRGTASAREHGNLKTKLSAYVQKYTATMVNSRRLT